MRRCVDALGSLLAAVETPSMIHVGISPQQPQRPQQPLVAPRTRRRPVSSPPPLHSPALSRHTRPLLAAGTGHLRSHLLLAQLASVPLTSCLLPRRGAEIRSASIVAARHLDLAPRSRPRPSPRPRPRPYTPRLHNITGLFTLSPCHLSLDGANVTPARRPSHPRLLLLAHRCATPPPNPSFAIRRGPCAPVTVLPSHLSS